MDDSKQNTPVNGTQPNPTGAPTFTPPSNQEGQQGNGSIPTFQSPNQQAPAGQAPTFKSPNQQGQGGQIPTFQSPNQGAPTFTAPTHTHTGPVCYYHEGEPAVAQCAKCGKYLCKDCSDAYGVQIGDYAGQVLCYDCTSEIVAQNVQELTHNRRIIKTQFIFSIIGIVFGFFLGLGGGPIGAIIGAAVGGVLVSALKIFFSMMWEVIKITAAGQFGFLTVLSIIFNLIVLVIRCIVSTISNTIYYINYLNKTKNAIESDSKALQEMKDYMEYTLVRNKNRGVDIDTLINNNSELADNMVAQKARTMSEEQIEEGIRNCVATINENGEIIRDFKPMAA